ncbi:MAG TPA: penicillin acylase [Xanthomonadaceae bacterium]|nr:penicillin acylase [Xanthomonadaceae bacterium]
MLKWIGRGLAALLVLAGLLALVVWLLLRASLPHYDGELALPGLSAPVSISRDASGMVDIEAANEADMARALGFVHGQERFFEMDLTRRVAAGELSALLGERALETDRRNRLHRLRARSAASIEAIAGSRIDVLRAYTEGVNAGLSALGTRPWPYLLLRQSPMPWTEVDTALTGYAMFFDLQDEANSRELTLWRIREASPPALAALLLRDGTSWDAPLFGTARGDAVLPTADVLDLRTLPQPAPDKPEAAMAELAAPGSNNFAAGAAATADGRAIVAGDMHLGLRAPSLWYRARLRYADASAAEGRVDVAGVTLPGVPGIIAGSTPHLAWAFTNSYGDWADFFRIDFTDAARRHYRTPDGEAAIVVHREVIAVAGGDDETLDVRETRWGPIAHDEADGSALALRWTAQLAGSLNLGLFDLARAPDLDAALRAAREAGVPAQNLLLGDAGGRIAWRLVGRIPARVGGCDPQTPLRPLEGCDWTGWHPVDAALQPELVDPPSARLWTANARVTDGELLALIGDAGYALGARQKQIAEAMLATAPIDEPALLALQLDDRAIFLERWNTLLRRTAASLPGDAQDIADAAADWNGHAAVDSSGYRITRAFRLEVLGRIRSGLVGPARVALGEDFLMPDLPQLEGVAWPLIEQRPAHLLPPRFGSWDELLSDAATSAATKVRKGTGNAPKPGPLTARVWGEANTSHVCHPLAGALPGPVGRALCMKAEPLPGDAQMPRVQAPAFGASQRMAVSPAHRESGIFQLPGGQDAHPLSPFWGAGHADWADGRPAPFLPGPAVATLRLRP